MTEAEVDLACDEDGEREIANLDSGEPSNDEEYPSTSYGLGLLYATDTLDEDVLQVRSLRTACLTTTWSRF